MEQAILALLGISITLTLYLDRGRRAEIALLRADNAQLRGEMHDGFNEARAEARADNAQLRDDMHDGFKEARAEARADNAQLRDDMHDGFKEARADNAQLRGEMHDGFERVHSRLDKLTNVVMDLCRRVGRLEGRAEAPPTNPDASQ